MSETRRAWRYHPHDLRFRSGATQHNPFLVEVRARLTAPGGGVTTVPGFYDGDGEWVIRVCPTATGEWRYVTESADRELDGQRGEFRCEPGPNPRVHGALRVDPLHPHHFLYEDGTRPFVLGYEANWLWALGFLEDGAARLRRFCERIAGYGYNHVFVNAYAHDTRWAPGQSRPEDYGPPPMYAWEGSNEAPDHLHPNVAYWRVFDVTMRALLEAGLTAHIYLKVYNKRVSWPAPRSLADDLYFAYVVARYQGFSNVVWDFSKESYNEPDKGYLESRIGLIRARDAYGRLVTTHDDDLFDTDPRYIGKTDFVTDQHHQHVGFTTLERRRLRAAPYVNEEFAYECGPGGLEDKTYGRSNTAEEHTLRSWEVTACGGYPGYYYTYTAWDVIRPDDTPPGYAQQQTLASFMRETQWWRLEPHPEMLGSAAAWCLARPGEEYLVFGAGKDDVRVTLIGAAGYGQRFRCRWLQPLSGEREDSTVALRPRAVLTPPWGDRVPFVALLRPEHEGTTRRGALLTGVAAGSAALLAACGADARGDQGAGGAASRRAVTLQFWSRFAAPIEEVETKMLPLFAERFAPYKVERSLASTDYGVLVEKITTAFAGGTPPDVFTMGSPDMVTYAHPGFALQLDGYARVRKETEDYIGPPLAVGRYKDKLYGLTYFVDNRLMHYRKDVLAELGLPTDRKALPKNWEQFRDVARRVARWEGDECRRLGWDTAMGDATPFMVMLGQFKKRVISEDGKRVEFDGPDGQRALQTLVDFYTRDRIDTNRRPQFPSGVDSLATPQLAIKWTNSSVLANVRRAGVDPDQLVVADLTPEFADKPTSASYLGGTWLMAAKDAKDKDAAVELTVFLAGLEVTLAIAEATSTVPARKSAEKSPYLQSANLRAGYESLQYAWTVPQHPQYAQIRAKLIEVTGHAMQQRKSVREALAEGAAYANAHLAGA